ncbi:transposable element Tc3 transposase [Trichonephila clavipes]|nr:transposable element Tc3 transposase [Trichonephila clavipes]
MAQRKHLDDFLRGRIIGRLECGRTQLEVPEELGIAQSVLSRLWQRFQDDATGTTASRQTVHRRLGHIGLYARRPVRCVPLTAIHCPLRLTWSREHALWTPQQWSCVMFSDESTCSLQSDSHRTLIWRTRYHQEKNIERHPYGGAGWLARGGIILGSRTNLHVQSVTMTGHIYWDDILEQHVCLFRGAMGAEFLFMDDNARPHHANIVDECLQSEDITRMDWPAYSPDLNPIEHVWDMLRRRIAARQSPPTCLPELRRALLDEWCNIPQDQIDNLILSMLGICAKIKDEVEKLAYQLNEEAERTERPIRRLSKVMYGSTCADMQVDVMGECLSSIKHVAGEQLSGGSVVVVHEEPHPQMTGTLSYRPEETGDRQREKSLDTRHRRLGDRYRVLPWPEDCTVGGLFARRPVRCVPLTPAHRRRRSLWCREHRNRRDNEWGRVLFTDESRFSLSSDSHRILIWRERGSHNHPSNIIESGWYGGRGVLVWGGIMLGSRTDLHIFDAGSVNGTRYCNEILLPYVRLFRGAMGLQVPFHGRQCTMSSHSSCRTALRKRLAARTLPPVTIRELRLALQDEWAAMPQQLIDNSHSQHG